MSYLDFFLSLRPESPSIQNLESCFYRESLQVLGYSDTDVAEHIYKNKPEINSLTSFICKDLTGACSSKPPPVPKVHSDTDMLILV